MADWQRMFEQWSNDLVGRQALRKSSIAVTVKMHQSADTNVKDTTSSVTSLSSMSTLKRSKRKSHSSPNSNAKKITDEEETLPKKLSLKRSPQRKKIGKSMTEISQKISPADRKSKDKSEQEMERKKDKNSVLVKTVRGRNVKKKTVSSSTVSSRAYCSECNITFSSEFYYDNHMYHKHGDDLDFSTGSSIKKLKTSEKKLDVTKLDFNQKSSQTSSKLDRIVCGETLSSNKGLDEHMNIHNDKHPLVREDYGISFRGKGSLFKHEQSHTDENSYICNVCQKEFMCRSYLRNHMRVHDERKFVCNYCFKCFKQKAHLQKHIKCVHDKIKDHVCAICNKGFSMRGQLILHERTHTNERPYVCKICKKAFKDDSYFNRHMRYHTGVRPYACLYCEKTFVQIIDMKRHSAIHQEELPFKCGICDHKSKLKIHMTAHMKLHSGEVYTCDTCNQAFSSASNRDRHFKTQHTLNSGLQSLIKK
ncbi:zinc finger protein 37-like [Ruditapes philippinarum]|uniref:zinc finger protein 37-like n=1 Tax=Ruditapes philippinarum TaxID=129788 RepID=UPI00295B7ABB|nr:zinc finger protein 37-like [Ruditapes philippinarum]